MTPEAHSHGPWVISRSHMCSAQVDEWAEKLTVEETKEKREMLLGEDAPGSLQKKAEHMS